MNRQIEEQFSYYAKEHPLLNDWFAYVMEGNSDSLWIWKKAEEDPVVFEDLILQLSEAVRLLPKRPIRFQDYSRIVTQDPQGLSYYKVLGQLFFHALAEDARFERNERINFPENDKERRELLALFNLIYDELNDRVSVANLFAETAESYHPVWESAVHTHSVLTVTIRELKTIETIYPANEKQVVWAIESPRIFSLLLDAVPNVPMICTYGEVSFAAKEVMDRLVEEGIELRYAGELNPKSIAVAEKWMMYYPKNMMPWKMDVESYLKARLKEQKLTNEELGPLAFYQLDIFSCLKDEMKDQLLKGNLEVIIGEMISELKYYYQ